MSQWTLTDRTNSENELVNLDHVHRIRITEHRVMALVQSGMSQDWITLAGPYANRTAAMNVMANYHTQLSASRSSSARDGGS